MPKKILEKIIKIICRHIKVDIKGSTDKVLTHLNSPHNYSAN